MKISAVRRVSSAGLVVALAAAGLLAVPSTSHAGVLDTPEAQAEVDFNGSVSCTQSGVGDVASPATPFAADGVPVTTTASSSATYTHNVDNTDVTTMTGSVTQTIRVTQAGGALRTIDVEAQGQVSLQATKGTAQACDASVGAYAFDVAYFDLPTPKYVTVQLKSKGGIGAVVFQGTTSVLDGLTQTVNYFLHSNMTQRVYLPAGTWATQIVNQGYLEAPTPTTTMSSPQSSKVEMHMTFDDPGVATGAAKGGGSKYLDLSAGRTCAAGSLSGKWKAKAGKGANRTVKKAVFRVDGVKVKTVKKPKKKQTTTLTGLDPDEMAEVSVTLKLVKKGAGKLTVERTYLPCT